MPIDVSHFSQTALELLPHVSMFGVNEKYVLQGEMSHQRVFVDRSCWFYIIASRELSRPDSLYLLQFIETIMADDSMSDGLSLELSPK